LSRSARIREVRKQIDQLNTELTALQRTPIEPPNGSVVTFTKTFGRSTYHYAAIRTVVGWFVTGQDGGFPMTWDNLLDYVDGNDIFRKTRSELVAPPRVDIVVSSADVDSAARAVSRQVLSSPRYF